MRDVCRTRARFLSGACSSDSRASRAAGGAQPVPGLSDDVRRHRRRAQRRARGCRQRVYWKVVDHCYLCDMCYMTKCPYVPPHPWNVDFPHLMLRAKAVKARKGESSFRDRLLTSTDRVGTLAGIPVVAQLVNYANSTTLGRKLLDQVLGVHPRPAPRYTRRARAGGCARCSSRPPPPRRRARRPAAAWCCSPLLRQPERTGAGDRPGGRVRAQRHRA